MKSWVVINKKIGETPLQALDRLRSNEHLPLDVPLTYAGRLDPMAEGRLLVLIGDECKKQALYHNLDKEYAFEVLLGFETDTGDCMGMPKESASSLKVDRERILDVIDRIPGTISLPYPHYSSKTVAGKPLFLWTLEGRLGEIDIPLATTTIYNIRYTDSRIMHRRELHDSIQRRIESLPRVTEESKRLGADFRREAILPAWDELLRSGEDVHILSFTATVSSGTYIRSLAPYIASVLGTEGLAYSINRTKIGRYLPLPFRLGFWIREYR